MSAEAVDQDGQRSMRVAISEQAAFEREFNRKHGKPVPSQQEMERRVREDILKSEKRRERG